MEHKVMMTAVCAAAMVLAGVADAAELHVGSGYAYGGIAAALAAAGGQ